MKILFSSHTFQPNLGGLETVSLLLAKEFVCAGHEVTVVTDTASDSRDVGLPFDVIRRPSLLKLLQLTDWADVVFHNNISLRAAWPLLLIRKPWIVAHHIWLPTGNRLAKSKSAFKRLALRYATGIAVSRAIADDFDAPCTIIPNPFDSDTFQCVAGTDRTRDLIFVGRFVSDKGLPILLEALVCLKQRGLKPSLTVIGAGPEEAAWRELCFKFALTDQVLFVGTKRGRDLASELNQHKVLVVPSLWNEPFGVVALEGMAAGCIIIGSDGGGLRDAIGPGGLTFPNGNVDALTTCLARALTDDELALRCRAAVPSHLSLHYPRDVAARYLEVFEHAKQRQ